VTEDEIIAEARAVLWRYRESLLAQSPLQDMADWVARGQAPAAATLRALGLNGPEAEDGPAAEALRMARRAFTRDWGFAIPCAEAITALRRLAPIVEVGAGSGCWATLMRAAGHDVIATDLAEGATQYGFGRGARGPVEQLSALDAVLAYPDRDVFCSWPSEKEPWLFEALRRVRPGRRIALILDDRGETTGDSQLRRFLEQECALIESVAIPQFPGVHDRLTVHERLAPSGSVI
jgi:hypothetical protein